nr:unnamed protein product [Callosobruchus chinensis]
MILHKMISNDGWGGHCDGEKIHGFWSQEDKENNINFLELLAAFNVLKPFCKELGNFLYLAMRLDNSTAISYINRMGGTRYKHINNYLTKEV